MSPVRLFFVYVAVLFATTCGLLGLLILSLEYFTYSGSGMDWIYPTSGAILILWMWSAFMAVQNGVIAIKQRSKRSNRKLG